MKAFAIALLAITFATQATANQVHIYEFEMFNAPGQPDDVSSRSAKALQNTRGAGACVDLRMLGSASSDKVHEGNLGLVTNRQLSITTLAAIEEAICQDSSDCHVKTSFKTKPLHQTVIITRYYKNAAGVFYLRELPPTFSKACETGDYSDSWNNAASTPEARKFLERHGVELNLVRTLDINFVDKGFTFGFPK